MMFLVSNTNSVGGFERLAPKASLQDGMFDFIVVKKISFPEFLHLTTLAMRGEHLNHPKVMYVQANRIKVQVESDMQLNLDGEYGGVLPAEFVNLYQHFQMLTPKNRKKRA